jgi:hypothetical protein
MAMNEPVAWLVDNQAYTVEAAAESLSRILETPVIPLYTHPVKELTDEEIRHIQAQCHLKNVGYDNFIMRFARAILRKAQEK